MGPMIVVLVRNRDLADLPVRRLHVIPAGLIPLCRCTEILLQRALQLVEPLLLLTLRLTKELDLREPTIGSRLEMEMHGALREAKELAAHFIVTIRDLLRRYGLTRSKKACSVRPQGTSSRGTSRGNARVRSI